jgi:pyruvate carboxylase
LFNYKTGVKIVAGTPNPIIDVKDAKLFAEQHGLPIIFKAAHGRYFFLILFELKKKLCILLL